MTSGRASDQLSSEPAETTSPFAIEVESLTKFFFDRGRGDVKALDDVSFRCARGEVVGLLGPNGAGKTTTLRVLTGLLKPASGSVRVQGIDVTARPFEARRHIGFITGATQLYGRLSPAENLTFFGRLYGLPEPKIAERIEALSETFQLQAFRATLCSKLSTGQRQRVGLARAVLHEPDVLLLDEPMSSLDIITSGAVSNFIRQARSDGRCVLLSTHNIAEAELLCDRVIVLHQGRVLAFDRLESLLASMGQASLSRALLELIERHESTSL